MRCPGTRFVCTRYGNVLASRGSVIPLFHEQIRSGGPVTITTPDMTRFLLALDDAVDITFAAIGDARQGETLVPRAPSARIADVATALIGDRPVRQVTTGIRPGEKIHEIMVSEEEAYRTVKRGRWYVIRPMLPELANGDAVTGDAGGCLEGAYSSKDSVMSMEETTAMLRARRLMLEDSVQIREELLR
jgi:UDP-glucose 4-epimerase